MLCKTITVNVNFVLNKFFFSESSVRKTMCDNTNAVEGDNKLKGTFTTIDKYFFSIFHYTTISRRFESLKSKTFFNDVLLKVNTQLTDVGGIDLYKNTKFSRGIKITSNDF